MNSPLIRNFSSAVPLVDQSGGPAPGVNYAGARMAVPPRMRNPGRKSLTPVGDDDHDISSTRGQKASNQLIQILQLLVALYSLCLDTST